MNSRKFFIIICTVLSVFMFCLGVLSLAYINFTGEEDNKQAYNDGLIVDILKPFKTVKEDVNILVLGGDKVNKNTDTMMLVNFDASTAKISILSIPRDTKVRIKSSNAKINSAYPRGGGDLAVKTVSELLNVDIKYYVFIDTSTFRKIVDILDGVDYYVPENMDYDDPLQKLHIHIKKGQQHFNGAKAEQFMRYRQGNNHKVTKNYDGSDLKRIDAQQNFIKEMIRQKVNIMYITKTSDILNVIFNSIDTNIEMDEVLRLSRNISSVKADEINMLKLPGNSVRDGAWYYEMDKAKTFEFIDQYFSSKDKQ